MFKIGDFARISGVSVKTLRYYDAGGLLPAAEVDRFTGYRYYSIGQLPRLNRILALKDLGFPLDQIAHLLAADLPPAQLRGMLRLRQSELATRVAADGARLARVAARLAQIEQEGTMSQYDVVLKRVDPQTVAAIRATIPAPPAVGQLFYELEAYLGGQGAAAAGFPFDLWHNDEQADGGFDTEVAIPVNPATVRGDARVTVRTIPGVAQAATLIYEGPYEGIGGAWAALGGWLEANGYRPTGDPCREVYLRFDATGAPFTWAPAYLVDSPAQFLTELQMPVAQE